MKAPTEDALHRRKGIIVADLLSKVEVEDWHGVADAAMDLREIEALLNVIRLQFQVRLVQTEGDH